MGLRWVQNRARIQPRPLRRRLEGPPVPLTVAQRAMALAGKYEEEAKRLFPMPGEKGYSAEKKPIAQNPQRRGVSG